jgi:hypothetical protein
VRYKPAEEMQLFRTLKEAFDPHGRFNPGKVLLARPQWSETQVSGAQ